MELSYKVHQHCKYRKKNAPSRANIDDKKLIYYVEEPTSLARITKDTLDQIINLDGSNYECQAQVLNFARSPTSLCIENLLLFPHLFKHEEHWQGVIS